MLRLECDRCKELSKKAVEIFGVEPHPLSNAMLPRPATYRLPENWSQYLGKDLCDKCTSYLTYEASQAPAQANV